MVAIGVNAWTDTTGSCILSQDGVAVPPTNTLAEPENDPPVEGFKVERPRCPQGGAFPVFVRADTVPYMAGAAFFDLDRTLLRGASGPFITEALIQAGPPESWYY